MYSFLSSSLNRNRGLRPLAVHLHCLGEIIAWQVYAKCMRGRLFLYMYIRNYISIYTLSDLGVLSNLIGSLSLANEHYSPPTKWIMRKPDKNKMAGVNSRFVSVSESIFNVFVLRMLLRSLPVYILKQLFFSISVNSGRIFTSISKNNC